MKGDLHAARAAAATAGSDAEAVIKAKEQGIQRWGSAVKRAVRAK